MSCRTPFGHYRTRFGVCARRVAQKSSHNIAGLHLRICETCTVLQYGDALNVQHTVTCTLLVNLPRGNYRGRYKLQTYLLGTVAVSPFGRSTFYVASMPADRILAIAADKHIVRVLCARPILRIPRVFTVFRSFRYKDSLLCLQQW
jgi:hypothetical protein